MDELGIATLVLPTGDVGRHGRLDPFDFEHIAARWEEVEQLVARWPGRFAALALDRSRAAAWRACARPAARLARPVGRSAATSTRTAGTAASTTPTTTRSTRSAPSSTCRSRCRPARRAASCRASAAGPISHRPRRALLPRHALRALAPRLALGRRGDRDGAQVPQRLPRHRCVPAAPLAEHGDGLPARPRPHQGGLRHELPDRRAPPRARRRWRSWASTPRSSGRLLGGTAQRVFTRLANGGHDA